MPFGISEMRRNFGAGCSCCGKGEGGNEPTYIHGRCHTDGNLLTLTPGVIEIACQVCRRAVMACCVGDVDLKEQTCHPETGFEVSYDPVAGRLIVDCYECQAPLGGAALVEAPGASEAVPGRLRPGG